MSWSDRVPLGSPMRGTWSALLNLARRCFGLRVLGGRRGLGWRCVGRGCGTDNGRPVLFPNGERIRRTAGTASKALAQEFHDRLKSELWRIAKLGEKPRRIWNEAVVRWLKEKPMPPYCVWPGIRGAKSSHSNSAAQDGVGRTLAYSPLPAQLLHVRNCLAHLVHVEVG